MRIVIPAAAAALALWHVSPAWTQEPTPPVAPAVASAPSATPAAPAAPAAPANVVLASTLVTIEIAEAIGTKTNKAGDTFTIRLAEPVTLGSDVVIPAGVAGKGQVVDSGRPGMAGKPAKLVLAARYLNWNGRTVPLKAFRWARTGKDRDTEAMALAFVPYVGMLSLFVQGGEIEVPVGARAMAKLAADVALVSDTGAVAPEARAAPPTNPSLPTATQGAPL